MKVKNKIQRVGNWQGKALAIAFLCFWFLANAQDRADVIVYGGTAGGITAAIEAAKQGKSVILLEPGNHLGGMSVEGLGSTDIDNHKSFQNSLAVGGLALEFYKRVAKEYAREEEFSKMLKSKLKNSKLWLFESHVAEKVFNEWISEYKVKVFFNSALAENEDAVKKKGTRITSIKMENKRVFHGTVFIDATIEADLLVGAGVSTTYGREANSQYGETLNGIQAVTDHAQFLVPVDPYKIAGDSTSGVIHTIQDEPLGTPGNSDKNIQAYCFRMCLTQEKENQIPFSKPDFYDRSHYEIYIRYERAGGKLYSPAPHLPNNKTDLGAWHDLSHNLYGMNKAYPDGSRAVRKSILQQHKQFTQGLFYFLSTDTAMHMDTRQKWSSWGLCKDEFVDNNGWPRNFYVREAKRMVSDYVVTQHNGSSKNLLHVEDPIAVAYWPMDVHSVRRIVKDGHAYNEGFVFGGNYWRPFGVSYRALIPKKSECTNLLTPTALSATHIAYGALRLEYNYMAHGQACGAAAAIAIDSKKPVQGISFKQLQKCLLDGKQVIDADGVGLPTSEDNK